MTTVTLDATEDAHVIEALPTTNTGSNTSLLCVETNGGSEYLPLLKFSLASIPANAIISSVKLRIYVTFTENNPTIRIRRITSSWAEGSVTWNTRPSADTSISHGTHASWSSNAYNEITLSASEFQKFIDGTYTWYGFQADIIYGGSGDNESIFFDSSEGANNPELVVIYNAPPSAPGAITSPVVGSTYGSNTGNQMTLTCGAATDSDGDARQYEWDISYNAGSSWSALSSLSASLSRVISTVGLTAGSQTRVRVRAHDGTVYGSYTTLGGNFTIIQNVAPNTPTALSQISATTDTTPTFQCSISDSNATQQIKARFQIYDVTETTLIATFDSSFRTGAGSVSAEYTSALAVGTYKVRAKTIDDLAAESSYSAFITIYIRATVTKDSIALWHVTEANIIDVGLQWEVLADNLVDLELQWGVKELVDPTDVVLLWSSETPWKLVNSDDDSPSWTLVVPEGS